jgi:hypothetical protein
MADKCPTPETKGRGTREDRKKEDEGKEGAHVREVEKK